MTRRAFFAPAAILLALALPTAALASWGKTGTGTGSATAYQLPTAAGSAPTAPTTGSTSNATVTVSWAAVNYSTTSIAAAGYVVKRYKGVAADTIAGTCTGTVTALTCNDTLTGAGAYQYTITPKSGAWTGTEGAKSGTVTYTVPDTSAPTYTLTCPTDGSGPWTLGSSGTWQASVASGGCASAISGSATDATGVKTVEISIAVSGSTSCWNGNNSFNASCPTFSATTLGTPNGKSTTWSIPVSRTTLAASKTYTVSVRTTDTQVAANVSTTTFTFTT